MVIVELTPFEESSCECVNLIVKAMRRHECVFSAVQVAASNITAAGTVTTPETREFKR